MTLESFSPIIETKLNRPRAPRDLVPRPALLEKLNRGLERPLTLITAPAGYGKSTLLSHWLDTLGDQPRAWLSLDASDDDLITFLTYVLAAVRTMYPAVGEDTGALLTLAENTPRRVLLATLVNELNRIDEDYVLAIDDYHTMHDAGVQQFMAEFIPLAPASLHLALASRSDPRLPLVTFRAQDKVTEIRAHELRFSMTEAHDFLSSNWGEGLDDTIAKNIYERSEGWVTGLRLAVLSLRRHEDLELLEELSKESNRFVIDYLMAETLSSQSAIIQEWLLKTAVLDRFCPGLCDAVAVSQTNGAPQQLDGKSFIRHVTSNNLFVVPLDNQDNWFRFHHLFGQFLRQEARQRYSPREIAGFHIRAAKWLADHKLLGESLHHYLLAGNMSGAADLVEKNVRAILDEDRWHVLENWMAQLSEAIIQKRPALLLAKAWESFHQFALPAIPPLLTTAEAMLGEDGSEQSLWGEVDFFWGHHWFWQGQQAQSLARLRQALEKIPTNHHFVRGEAELFWGLAMQASGREEEAVFQLQEWLFAEPKMHPGRQDKLVGALLFVHLLSADLREAMLYARRQQDIAEEYNIRYLHAWIAYVFGYIDFQHNDLPGAIGYFTQAARNRYVLHDRAALDSLVGLAVANQMLNREDDARAALQDLLDFAWESNNASYMAIARTCQARLAMLQDDSAAARRWLQKADLTMDAGMLFYWLEIPRVTQVRVLMADSGEAGLLAAEEQLQDLLRLAQETHNKAQMIEILVLQACLYRRQERINDALASLEQAIVLASAGNWLRPFVEVGAELQDLVPRLSPRSRHKLFLQKVQHEIAPHSLEQKALHGQAVTLAEELTYREQEVLALLADEMSNQEIAQTLTISINTVKRHTGSLYRKLDVKNRRQAVTKARRLALLPAK